MIIKASQRGGAKALGVHLLKSKNEQVEVHEISGFASDNLIGAMKEAQAVAKGTRCKQYLFSVSLNPPEKEAVPVEAFEAAINKLEEKLGLQGQPRMIVFHEKEGRRHAHAVWSRIDAATMTARQMSHFKMKIRDVSKELYLEHGWQMPRGLMNSREHDPKNFNLAEWQQAKRMGRDPKKLKGTMQECWAMSDGRPAFEKALRERGLYLAKGDRRAHVAVTYEGEIVSVARMVGVKTKDVAAKLGKADELRSVEDVRFDIAGTIRPRLQKLIEIADQAKTREMQPLSERRLSMRDQHRLERQRLDEGQKARSVAETRERSARFRAGVAGLWDRISGQHGRIVKQNETEAYVSFKRDRAQRDDLVAGQLADRRVLQRDILAVRHRHTARVTELHRDLARQGERSGLSRDGVRSAFENASRQRLGNESRSQMPSGRNDTGQRGASMPAKPRGPSLGG